MIVANGLGKVISIIVPIIFISLLQLSAIKNSFMGFLVLADLPRKSPPSIPLSPPAGIITIFPIY